MYWLHCSHRVGSLFRLRPRGYNPAIFEEFGVEGCCRECWIPAWRDRVWTKSLLEKKAVRIRRINLDPPKIPNAKAPVADVACACLFLLMLDAGSLHVLHKPLNLSGHTSLARQFRFVEACGCWHFCYLGLNGAAGVLYMGCWVPCFLNSEHRRVSGRLMFVSRLWGFLSWAIKVSSPDLTPNTGLYRI